MLRIASIASALIAFAGAASTAHAVTYNLNVYQGSMNGGSSAADAVTSTAPTYTNSNFSSHILSGTYTSSDGNLDFELGGNGTNTVRGFLNSGTGGASSYSFTNNSNLNNTLSTSGFGTQTTFFFTGNSITVPSTVTITHDDGIAFYLGSHLISPASAEGPTSAELTTFSITAQELAQDGGAFELVYVEANGLPAELNMSIAATPLPAALPLFASGLGALGLLGWRRKRSARSVAA
jgi:hypothetical protein